MVIADLLEAIHAFIREIKSTSSSHTHRHNVHNTTATISSSLREGSSPSSSFMMRDEVLGVFHETRSKLFSTYQDTSSRIYTTTKEYISPVFNAAYTAVPIWERLLSSSSSSSSDGIFGRLLNPTTSVNREASLASNDDHRHGDRRVLDFLIEIEDRIRVHPFWSSYNEGEDYSIREGVEKYLLTRIPEETLGRLHEVMQKEDDEVYSTHVSLSFLTTHHLNVPRDSIQNDIIIDMSVAALRRINNVIAPSDKLACIVECCRIVFSSLRLFSRQEVRFNHQNIERGNRSISPRNM